MEISIIDKSHVIEDNEKECAQSGSLHSSDAGTCMTENPFCKDRGTASFSYTVSKNALVIENEGLLYDTVNTGWSIVCIDIDRTDH